MKKILSLSLALMLVLISLFTLGLNNKQINAATLSAQEKVDQEVENIVMPEKAIIDFPVVYVSAYGSTIEWESDNSAILDVPQNGGWVTVNRPSDADTIVTLTVTITLEGSSASKEFEILVPKGTTQTNTYNISYELNGGTQNIDNPTSYKVGQSLQLADPTKGTVEFMGWYDNPEFAGTAITSLPKGLSGDYKLYAKWAQATVESIEVTKVPTKVTYNALEKFDATGIEVKANYNDGITSIVLDAEEIAKLTYDKDVLHGDDTTVTVTYEGVSAIIDITVNKLNYNLDDLVFDSQSKVYTGLAQQLDVSGLPAGLKANLEGSAINVSEGAVDVTLSFVNENERDYNTPESITKQITITKAPLTVTAKSQNLKVGQPIAAFEVNYTGFVNGETSSVLGGELAFACSATQASPKGEYPIVPSGLTADNYEIEYVNGTVYITDGTYSVVSEDLVKVYNGENQMFTPIFKDGNQVISGIEFTYECDGAPFTGAKDVKAYTVIVRYDDATYGKGEATFTFEITPLELSVDMFSELENVSYNGNPHTPDVNGTFKGAQLVKGTDYTLSYTNNTEVGEATVTVTGIGNFQSSVDLTFTIRESDLTRVQDTKAELATQYESLNGVLNNTDDLMVESTTNETSIFWMSTSTALSIDTTGKVSVILTDVEQTVVLYALITAGDAVEYQMFTVTLPAKETKTDTNSNVQVEDVQSNVQLKVEETDGSEANYQVTGNEEVVIGYDITLQQNSSSVQPMNEVTVKLPVPAGYNQESLKVYYVQDGQAPVDMNATVDAEGEYLVFTTDHFSKYIIVGELEQTDQIQKITISDFLNKEVNAEVYYELTGVIQNITNTTYGNFDLVDQNDSSVKVYVYGLTATQVSSNDKSFAYLDLVEGDVVTLIGVRADYKGTAQVGGPAYCTSHIPPTKTVSASSSDITKGNVELSAESVKKGEFVTLTFAPTTGYEASSITVNGGEPISVKGKTTYEYQVLEDTNIVVEFAEYVEVTSSVITFNGNGGDGDGSSALAEILPIYIATTDTYAKYIQSVKTISKIYTGKGTNGFKFGTSSAKGELAFVLNEGYYVSGVKLTTSKWTNNTGSADEATISVNGVTSTDGINYIFESSSNEIYITTTTSSKQRFYLISIELILTGTAPVEKTDEEKVDEDIANLETLNNKTIEDKLELPSDGANGSVITWVSDNASVIKIEDGNAVITRPAAGQSDANVVLTATVSLNEVIKTKEITITVKAIPSTPVADTSSPITYTFADYTQGTQYAVDEVHVLDTVTTVTTTKAHFTSELRLYDNSTNDAVAVFEFSVAAKSLVLNIGNKAGSVTVFVSTDGITYTELEVITTTDSSYADYTVDLEGSYKYVKLDSTSGQQMRIKYVTVTFDNAN